MAASVLPGESHRRTSNAHRKLGQRLQRSANSTASKVRRKNDGNFVRLELDTGFYGRGLTFERIVSDFGEQLIVLMIECEDAKLNDLGRDEFE